MKLAYLTSQYPASSHTFIRREIEALRRRGVHIETFSIRPPSAAELVAEADRREHERTWYFFPARPLQILAAHAAALCTHPLRYFGAWWLAMRHRVPGARALLWAMFHFVEAIVLARALRKRGLTHLHNHFANSAANVGLCASHYLGMPWSLTLHGISETDYPAGVLLGEKIRAAKFVACVSHFGRAQAMRTVGPEHWPKLFVSRCGVETSRLPARDLASRPRARVLCVGRLSPEKGHVGLLDAFVAVRARGIDAELRLAGDGPDAARIARFIEAHGLRAHVTMLGRLTEEAVWAEIAKSDVLVSGSLMEGLPVVLMEALAMGVAVVAPCVAGIPELVEHGVTGWLFSPGDFQALAVCLEEALSDPKARDRHGREGQTRVAREFDIDRAIEPLLARWTGDASADRA